MAYMLVGMYKGVPFEVKITSTMRLGAYKITSALCLTSWLICRLRVVVFFMLEI